MSGKMRNSPRVVTPPVIKPSSVMIIDDDREICEIVARLLRKEGLQVQMAHDGNTGLDMLRLNPDVLLVDFKLPDMDGLEVLKKAKEMDRDLPVVLITAFGGIQGAVEAIKTGAHDYLAKPFDPHEVVRVVGRALTERELKKKIKYLSSQVQSNHQGKRKSENLAGLQPPQKNRLSLLEDSIQGQVVEPSAWAQFTAGFSIDLFSGLPAALFIAQDGKFQVVDSAFESLTSYEQSEICGKGSLILVHPEEREQVRSDAVEMLKGNLRHPFEFRIITKSGETKWIVETVTPIQYQNRPAILGLLMDITARKQADEALARSSKRNQLILEAAGEGIFGLDMDGIVTFVNPAAANILGYEPEEIIGQNSHEVMHHSKPDGQPYPRKECPICACLNDGDIRKVADEIFWRKDGTGVPIEYVSTPKMEIGKIVGAVIIFKDITERKQAEAILRESERNYRLLVNNIPAVVFKGYLDWSISFYDNKIEELTGYNKEEFASHRMKWSDVILPEDLIRAKTIFKEALKSDGAYIREYRIRNKKGEIVWIQARGQAVYNKDGEVEYISGVFFDITDNKRFEEELVKQKEELTRSNADLEAFAYAASHDLQEPLRNISGYLQILKRHHQEILGTEGNDYIDRAINGATRMRTLINDLLTYSRIGGRSNLKPTDCQAVCSEALANLATTIAKSGVTVTCDPLPAVMGNPHQLVQLLQNVIGNAIKFRQGQSPKVHVSAVKNGDKWVFAVQDNGIGIEAEYTDRIFGLFQRLHTRTEYSGTGIGLAAAKRIVELHGGSIWVKSAPNQGSTFYFSLPQEGGGQIDQRS